MAGTKKIKTALISVFHKDGLDELLKKLNEEGVKFLSTGGTQAFIESLGYECQAVESVTSYPSILGGRVKTLHPRIFGGILARRDNEGDRQQMAEYAIPEIDLVIVDLYPFRADCSKRCKRSRHHREDRYRWYLAHPCRSQELQRRCYRSEQGRVWHAP